MKVLALLPTLLVLASPMMAIAPTVANTPGVIAPLELAKQTKADAPWDLFELVNSEAIDGWLALNLPEETVLATLGQPDTKDRVAFWGALEVYVQSWHYPEQGIKIDMMSEWLGGPQEVLRVQLNESATSTTARGIGIGSTWAEVEAAYGDERELGTAGAENIFVAGSIYGGVIFSFEGDRVSEIMLGAGAE